MIVYLSGAYSGDIDRNIKIARKIAIELWESGFSVITPHLNTYRFEQDCNCTYEDYIKRDIEILSRCDAVIMIPGFADSNGAKKEKDAAIKYGIPVFYYPDAPKIINFKGTKNATKDT